MLDELKKFKVQTILVLENKKIDDHQLMRKIFHSSSKLVAIDPDIDKVFRSMHQSVMTKIENSFSEDWLAKTIVEHDTKICEC